MIGLAGDRVACCDSRGRVTVNGTAVAEPYRYPGDEPSQEPFSVTVPAGRLWVMGDHRGASQDSRSIVIAMTGRLRRTPSSPGRRRGCDSGPKTAAPQIASLDA